VVVRVVTDSTACLPAGFTGCGPGPRPLVVPVPVTIDDETHDDGGVDAAAVITALQHRLPVTTSRIAPARLAGVYRGLVAEGATAIVSVHLSGHLSGTADSARIAAGEVAVPVAVVDTATVAMGLGFAAGAAARWADVGAEVADVAAAARRTAAASGLWFVVRDLAHLRRGGRMTAGQALVGSALHVLPILGIEQGRIAPVDRVRTMRAAQRRLLELACAHIGGWSGSPAVDVALMDCPPTPGPAAAMREAIADRIAGAHIVDAWIDTVLAAHTGPGTFALAVAPHEEPPHDSVSSTGEG